jgi:hypothetical protein
MLGFDAECPIEFAGTVFPGDRRRQFHDFIFTEELSKTIKEFVRHVLVGDRDPVGILHRYSFTVIKERAQGVITDCQNLLARDAMFATNCSVDILSEHASIQRSHTAVDQGG